MQLINEDGGQCRDNEKENLLNQGTTKDDFTK
jgi:hypothetical protein